MKKFGSESEQKFAARFEKYAWIQNHERNHKTRKADGQIPTNPFVCIASTISQPATVSRRCIHNVGGELLFTVRSSSWARSRCICSRRVKRCDLGRKAQANESMCTCGNSRDIFLLGVRFSHSHIQIEVRLTTQSVKIHTKWERLMWKMQALMLSEVHACRCSRQ